MIDVPRCGAIVLAAGRSSRFEGGHKLLADIGGQPLIRRTLEAAAASNVDNIVLVVAPETEAALRLAAGDGRWSITVNTEAARGLSTSLRAGLAALPQNILGALVILADMPGLTPGLIARLLARAAEYPGSIVYPLTGQGQQGHPVFWPADIFPEFADLRGDQGAKPLLRRHAHRIVTIPADESAAIDIDTVEDLAAFQRGGGDLV